MGYGIVEEEWPDRMYPEVEVISVGHSRKQHQVKLPFGIWWPCTVLWVQGLDVMMQICMIKDGEL